MERRTIFCLLATALLLFGASPAHSGSAAVPGKGKLVDINSASSKELTTLPGVTAAAAAKIVAGRPYGSKAQLVSRGAIDEPTYQGLRQLIVARQPYKDSARNAALQARQK